MVQEGAIRTCLQLICTVAIFLDTMCAFKSEEANSLIRETNCGKVRGFTTSPRSDAHVENYLGIPYALPPVHQLRFEPPSQPKPWSPKILDATHLPPACLQIVQTLEYIQRHRPLFNQTKEDCLYLNIYVPVRPADHEPLSVLVFIHGGSNMAGMGAFFDGDYLAAHGGFIVITFNYRLAALGFLGTGQAEFPGNYGLLDQVLLLKWVNQNIHFFGGNPKRVTLMGHSAGSFNVGLHIISPMAKGLFQTAICLSGSPLSAFAVRRLASDSLPLVRHIAHSIRCDMTDLRKLKECLKSAPQISLMKDFPAVYVEGYLFPTIVDNIYIHGQPEELFKTAELNVDLVVSGVTKDEGITFVSKGSKFMPLESMLQSMDILPQNSGLYAIIKHEYTHWENEMNETASLQLYGQAFGDAVFNAPLARMADLLVARNATVYVYKFEYRSKLDPRPVGVGVPHGADLFFLFGCPFSGHPKYNYTDEDRIISQYYMDMVSNIVKRRVATVPKNISDPRTTTQDAPAYRISQPNYIRFSEKDGKPFISLAENFRTRKIYMWNKLLPFLNEKFANASTSIDTSGIETDNVFVILFGIFLAATILQAVTLIGCCILIRRHR